MQQLLKIPNLIRDDDDDGETAPQNAHTWTCKIPPRLTETVSVSMTGNGSYSYQLHLIKIKSVNAKRRR